MEKFYLYVVLTRTNTMASKMIHLITHDEYAHAAISFDKNLRRMYGFSRKYTYNPFLGGFNHEDINEGIYRFNKVLPGTIIEIEVTNKQYKKAQRLVEDFIYNNNLYKYNYKGLINNLLNREKYYDHRFLCSEFVYYILNKSGIADLAISRNLVRPQNLLDLNGRIIFQGDLKKLKSLNYHGSSNEALGRGTVPLREIV